MCPYEPMLTEFYRGRYHCPNIKLSTHRVARCSPSNSFAIFSEFHLPQPGHPSFADNAPGVVRIHHGVVVPRLELDRWAESTGCRNPLNVFKTITAVRQPRTSQHSHEQVPGCPQAEQTSEVTEFSHKRDGHKRETTCHKKIKWGRARYVKPTLAGTKS